MTATVTESTRTADTSTLSQGSPTQRWVGRPVAPTTVGRADRRGGRGMSRLEPRGQASTDRVRTGTRTLLVAFAVFTLLAALDLLALSANTERYFAWTFHGEPNAAFLGAAYAAGLVLSVLGLRQHRWSHIRVALVTVTIFTVLTLVPTLVHLHKFHLMAGGPLARFAAWLWLVVYLVIPVACLVVVGRQWRRSDAETVRRPMPRWLMVLLAAQGAVLLAAGAVLFAGGATVHHMAAEFTGFWAWPVTPLTSQALGAWLVAFGFAAGLAIWERDLSRLLVPAVAYTAFGVFELLVLLRYRTQVTADEPWLWAYVAVLATIVLTGSWGWWAARRRPDGAEVTSRSRSAADHAGESVS